MEGEYFKKALSNFTMDFAAGGQIKALTDKGLSVKEIKDRLDFPLPEETVRSLVWKRLLETGTVLLEAPSEGSVTERVKYEKVQGAYGKTSFKRVSVTEENDPKEYVPCEFGKLLYKDAEAFKKSLEGLPSRDRDYVLELPWPLTTVWHVRDDRMERILSALGSD